VTVKIDTYGLVWSKTL